MKALKCGGQGQGMTYHLLSWLGFSVLTVTCCSSYPFTTPGVGSGSEILAVPMLPRGPLEAVVQGLGDLNSVSSESEAKPEIVY